MIGGIHIFVHIKKKNDMGDQKKKKGETRVAVFAKMIGRCLRVFDCICDILRTPPIAKKKMQSQAPHIQKCSFSHSHTHPHAILNVRTSLRRSRSSIRLHTASPISPLSTTRSISLNAPPLSLRPEVPPCHTIPPSPTDYGVSGRLCSPCRWQNCG